MGKYDELAKELAADAKAYRDSVYADDTDEMFTLAYQWQDKPLRHINDLCIRIEIAATAITTLEAELAAMKARGDRLARYARHYPLCGMAVGKPDECTCGFEQALTEWRDQ